MKYSVSLLLSLMFVTQCLSSAVEINTRLMYYTYRIEGPTGEPNKVTFGTGFLMVVPEPNRPGEGQAVLVTAAHVLSKISGSDAKIYLRQEVAEHKFKKVPWDIRIRDANTPLWVQHPTADVAVMKMPLPPFVSSQSREVGGISTDELADDRRMEKWEIHPGDELLCLGYPLGAEANPEGFAILRSGRIASFPLTPASEVKSFLFDFEVFNGNSGGPVYFVDRGRTYGGVTYLDEMISSVVGLVTEQAYQPQLLRSVRLLEDSPERLRYEVTETRERLKLGVVVPAQFIKETLDILNKK